MNRAALKLFGLDIEITLRRVLLFLILLIAIAVLQLPILPMFVDKNDGEI